MPPTLQWSLVERLLTLWADMLDVASVVGGDWNDVQDVGRDGSRTSGGRGGTQPTKLHSLVARLDWVDTWWHTHGDRREFTYLSAVQKSFSRIDCVFVPRATVANMVSAEILPRRLSDHSPVASELQMGRGQQPFRWRLAVWNL